MTGCVLVSVGYRLKIMYRFLYCRTVEVRDILGQFCEFAKNAPQHTYVIFVLSTEVLCLIETGIIFLVMNSHRCSGYGVRYGWWSPLCRVGARVLVQVRSRCTRRKVRVQRVRRRRVVLVCFCRIWSYEKKT